MRLHGMDAINYVKAQGGKLNRFPDGIPGVEYDISLEKQNKSQLIIRIAFGLNWKGRDEKCRQIRRIIIL